MDPMPDDVPIADSPEDLCAGSTCEDPQAAVPKAVAHVAEILAKLAGETAQAFGGLKDSLDALGKQISYIPPQVRALGGKVDSLGAAISEARYRGLLLGLLGILDIVEQIQRVMAGGVADTVDHGRSYEVLRVQLRQLLQMNGLAEVSADGTFDPSIHRALERVESADPADHNRVLQVLRPGYRTEQSVLRYAEVKVGYCPGQAAESNQPN